MTKRERHARYGSSCASTVADRRDKARSRLKNFEDQNFLILLAEEFRICGWTGDRSHPSLTTTLSTQP
jgi:hypothetical protein